VTAPAGFDAGDLVSTTAPADAAFLLVTITISTNATQSAARTIKLAEVTVMHGSPELLLTDRSAPQTYQPAVLQADGGELLIQNGSAATFIMGASSTSLTGALDVIGNLNTDAIMTAANIASGVVTVTPVANATTGVAVTGLTVKTSAVTATQNDVSILVTAISAADALRTSSVSAPTFSGANLTGLRVNIFRTNTTATGVYWFAIGR